ncbi:VOC family protein [Streptomyces fradiae]|uniref:VOC family protein n=1 Tax=Streptomyces fradiae TaxID=1906 RepID=UPI0035140F45
MPLRPAQVTIKALDAPAVGRFWAEALGWAAYDTYDTYDTGAATCIGSAGGGLGIGVVPVPDGKTATKNRTHLDLATTSPAHQAELVTRLRDLGATPVDLGQGEVPWVVLADPEGNEFCVLEAREVYRDTGPIAAIVVDCADPRAMARFWGVAIDWTPYEVSGDLARFRSPAGTGPYLEFLRVPGAHAVPPVPDRVRLDLLPYPGDDTAAEVARLCDLGATGLGRTHLADPEGHAFRVLAPR